MSELGAFYHYVENGLLKARVMLNFEDIRGADEMRINLIGQLRRIENGNSTITQYIAELSSREWKKRDDLNRFIREYETQFSGLKVFTEI